MDHAANLLRAMAPLEQVLRATTHKNAVKGARQSSEDGVSSQLPASLDTEFHAFGDRFQRHITRNEIGKAMARDMEALKCKTAQ